MKEGYKYSWTKKEIDGLVEESYRQVQEKVIEESFLRQIALSLPMLICSMFCATFKNKYNINIGI